MQERIYAGHRRGMLVGLKRLLRDKARMNRHWVGNDAGRMYWCDCMLGFRVGDRTRYPRQFYGSKARTKGQTKGRFRLRVRWHRERSERAGDGNRTHPA